MKFNVNN